MTRPNVNIKNYHEVYGYYHNRRINPRVARAGHFISRIAIPRGSKNLFVEPEVQEEITDLLHDASGETRLVLAGNHLAVIDPFILAGVVREHEFLHPLMTSTSIVAKHSLFKPWPIRCALDGIGAIPAFLSHRTRSQFDSEEELMQTQRAAAIALGRVAIERMRHGNNLVMYAEVGGRNHEEPRTVQQLHSGIGHIVVGGSGEFRMVVVPVGLGYPGTKKRDYLRPQMVFGAPIYGPFDNPQRAISLIHTGLQEAVDLAYSKMD